VRVCLLKTAPAKKTHDPTNHSATARLRWQHPGVAMTVGGATPASPQRPIVPPARDVRAAVRTLGVRLSLQAIPIHVVSPSQDICIYAALTPPTRVTPGTESPAHTRSRRRVSRAHTRRTVPQLRRSGSRYARRCRRFGRWKDSRRVLPPLVVRLRQPHADQAGN
jgi:hypothetical protein